MAHELGRSYDADTQNPRRLDTITALRFPAAAMIVACHAGALVAVSPPLLRLQMGVTVFFVLSGFVLTWGCAGMDLRTFYVRRAARIVPLYLLAVVFGLIVDLVTGIHPTALIALTTFTCTQAWIPHLYTMQTIDGPTWSLSCEVFFYLVFPFIVPLALRLRHSSRLALLGACVAFTMIYFLVLLSLPVARDLFWFPIIRLPEFFAGVLLCLEVRDGLRVPWSAAIVATALAVPVAIYQPGIPVAESGVAIIPTVLLIGAGATNDLAGRRQPSRILIDLGTWSYALYLIHLPIMQFVESRDWQVAALVSAVIVGISALVYRLFEAPVERSLRRRLLSSSPPVTQALV